MNLTTLKTCHKEKYKQSKTNDKLGEKFTTHVMDKVLNSPNI